MIRWSTFLFLASAAFAQQYIGAPNMPLDYHDDIYNRDMRIPASNNFVYNFEQIRRDQPPQVEMREENLGKYMGRARTTTPLPRRPHISEHRVPEIEHVHHLTDGRPVTMKPYVPQQWDPINSHLPPTIPPPPTTPKWMDLSDDSFKHHSHHQPARRPVNTYQAPTQPPVPQWNPAPMAEVVQQPEMTYTNPMPYGPTHQEYSIPMAPEHYAPKPQQTRGTSRGSHKFSWSDVAAPESAPMMPSTTMPSAYAPQSHGAGAPHSIPTLSPWAGDNFGK